MSSSATAEEEPDLLNLYTYTWAEWTVFTSALLLFGCCCCVIGVCYHKWRMRRHILTDKDIEDYEDTNDDMPRFRATFQQQISKLLTPRSTTGTKSGKSSLFSPTLKKNPMTFTEDQIKRHLATSIQNEHTLNISPKNGKLQFDTISEVSEVPPKAPQLSMTESQINKIIGKSVSKAPAGSALQVPQENDDFLRVRRLSNSKSVSSTLPCGAPQLSMTESQINAVVEQAIVQSPSSVAINLPQDDDLYIGDDANGANGANKGNGVDVANGVPPASPSQIRICIKKNDDETERIQNGNVNRRDSEDTINSDMIKRSAAAPPTAFGYKKPKEVDLLMDMEGDKDTTEDVNGFDVNVNSNIHTGFGVIN